MGLIEIERGYVDPVDDSKLVNGCREAMLSLVPQASIPGRWSSVEGSKQALKEIGDAYSVIQQQNPDIESGKLADACLNGMMRTLDERSAFLDADEFKDLQISSAGIGIDTGLKGGHLVVVSPIENGPAWKAGLKPGDVIVAIDEKPIDATSLRNAVRPLRGPRGSPVKLTVEREGEKQPLEFALVRDYIVVQSVKWALLPDGIAYIRITRLYEHTGEKLVEAIADVYAKNGGEPNGLILDLRANPGGLLNAAVAVAAAFLPRNALIVSTNGQSADAKMKLYASKEYYIRGNKDDYMKKLPPSLSKVPMVVLVDRDTASGSEIIAAALQDHKRATVMGAVTYGVETVQTILPLGEDTALKLTTARYFRPNGNAVGPAGVTPDVLLNVGIDNEVLSSSPKDDPGVAAAIGFLRTQKR